MKIFYELRDLLTRNRDTRRFDTKTHICEKYMTDKEGLPVVILKSREDSPTPYKVVFNSSSISFKNYYDAYMFCKERFHGIKE